MRTRDEVAVEVIRKYPVPSAANGGEKMATQVMAVRGICQHGKVRFLAVDELGIIDAKCRKEIGEMVAAGYTIDRVTVEEARKSDWNCPECNAAKPSRSKTHHEQGEIFG